MSGFTDGRTLGSELRGGRLGFRWVPDVRAYLRVTDDGDLCAFDLRPPDQLPTGRTKSGHHRVWWGNPVVARDVAALCLRVVAGDVAYARLKRPVRFLLDPADDAITCD